MGEWIAGPWIARYESMDVISQTEKGTMKVCDIRGWGHLTGHGHGALGLSESEALAIQKANLRLIAAAPDMYEALDAVAEATSDELNDGASDVWRKISDALAKVILQVPHQNNKQENSDSGFTESKTPQNANLRLIAAAPDMYEALDAIIQYFADHGSTVPSNYLERAYAALDKARGR